MASIAPTNSLAMQLFEKYSIGTVLGLVAVSHQVGGAIGAWVPGILYDLTGSYSAVLIVSVAMLAVSITIVMRIAEPKNIADA
jgi:predicted MFS family arabinose efflux permease